MDLQTLANGLVLGAVYTCMAIGFSLVWGVLNVINVLHGSFIVLGGYITFFAWLHFGIHPIITLPFAGLVLYGLGYLIQLGVINKVVAEPVLTTFTLTFGLDLILHNFMNVAFTATPRGVTLNLGTLQVGDVFMPYDRLLSMVLAIMLTVLLFVVMRTSRIGRAIVAVRMDRDAAALMGIRVKQIYAITFGLGAFMAGTAGAVLSLIFPVSTQMSYLFLGKAFVVCVLGGLGSVPGAIVGGLVLGIIESYAGNWFGPEHAMTVGFVLMIILLVTRPTGLMGRKGYE